VHQRRVGARHLRAQAASQALTRCNRPEHYSQALLIQRRRRRGRCWGVLGATGRCTPARLCCALVSRRRPGHPGGRSGARDWLFSTGLCHCARLVQYLSRVIGRHTGGAAAELPARRFPQREHDGPRILLRQQLPRNGLEYGRELAPQVQPGLCVLRGPHSSALSNACSQVRGRLVHGARPQQYQALAAALRTHEEEACGKVAPLSPWRAAW